MTHQNYLEPEEGTQSGTITFSNPCIPQSCTQHEHSVKPSFAGSVHPKWKTDRLVFKNLLIKKHQGGAIFCFPFWSLRTAGGRHTTVPDCSQFFTKKHFPVSRNNLKEDSALMNRFWNLVFLVIFTFIMTCASEELSIVCSAEPKVFPDFGLLSCLCWSVSALHSNLLTQA